MTTFHCRALNASGQLVEESREGDSVEAIIASLESGGMTPLSVTARAKSEAGVITRGIGRARGWNARDLSVFSRQLSTMLAASVPFDEALNTLAGYSKPEHEVVLRSLSESVRRGESLSRALEEFPEVFPRTYVATVAASETVGRLETSLIELANVLDWETQLRRDVRGALQYPATVLVAIGVAVIVLQQVVVPQFSGFFARLGSDLPLPTKLLFGSANLVTNYWWALLAGAAFLAVAARRAIATEHGRYWFHNWLIRVPVVGTLIHRMHLARFARILGLLQSSGLPILSALELMKEASGNAVIAKQLTTVRERVAAGESLGDATGRHKVFTPIVVSMIKIGEGSGRLDIALDMVARYYEEESRAALRDLTRWIEPALTLFLGGFVLFLALAIFLPWWDMTNLYQR
ncbi:MAG: type II secretion system F family protein [Planctomycetota bacterium]